MSRKASGFTLIEMLIVVAILAVLSGVGFSYYQQYTEDARVNTVRLNLKIVRDAISRYFKDHMAYPQKLDEGLHSSYLQQTVSSLLTEPLTGTSNIMVEVVDLTEYPVNYNIFNATKTIWIDYDPATHDGRRIRNIKVKYNGIEMNW